MPERFRVVCIPYKALYKCSELFCSHFASHSRFVTVFSVCKVSLQSFDITPPESFLSIIIIIIIILVTIWYM